MIVTPLDSVDAEFQNACDVIQKLRGNICATVFGQEDLIDETLCAFLGGGHILMTGAPGLAKTTLVRVFAKHLGLAFGRVQFTPDLLPSDITGSEILNIDPETQKRSFEFAKGPIFANLLLADEINRASPRTQSAMLEAMQERTVTIAGIRHELPRPFMVFATQNPFESEGTFPLPEAQLDRFLISAIVGYPGEESEMRILADHAQSRLVGELPFDAQSTSSDNMVVDEATVSKLLLMSQSIQVDDTILAGINCLVRSSRPDDKNCPEELKPMIWYGAGPRAGLSLISTARSYALLQGSDSVRWNHVRRMALPVLRHRIRLTAQASHDQLDEDYFVNALLTRLEDQQGLLAKGLV